MAKYSIVVPVYNTESYLDECISSILSQTIKDFELILVNDGSTDRSGTICDHYREKDSRIAVYHNKNGGVSNARNYGIDRASGEFICFIDSDDVLSPVYLENADKAIGICDVLLMHRVWSRSEVTITPQPTDLMILNENEIKTLLLAAVYRTGSDFSMPRPVNCNVITDKIYRLDFLNKNNLRFKPGIKMAEDKLFNFCVFSRLGSAAYISNAPYYLRRNTASATQAYMPRCFDTNMAALNELKQLIDEYPDPDIKKQLTERYACALSGALRNCLTLDYCSKGNRKSYAERKADFENDFRRGEICRTLTQCRKQLFVPYERYLNAVFQCPFSWINIIMKHRWIRLGSYCLYRLFVR